MCELVSIIGMIADQNIIINKEKGNLARLSIHRIHSNGNHCQIINYFRNFEDASCLFLQKKWNLQTDRHRLTLFADKFGQLFKNKIVSRWDLNMEWTWRCNIFREEFRVYFVVRNKILILITIYLWIAAKFR